MSVTHTQTLVIKRNGSQIASYDVAITEEQEHNWDFTLSASQTNYDLPATIDYSKIKSLFINTSTACTIKTNSTGSPDNTFTMTADAPLVWNSSMPTACPITASVTHFYLTNSTATTDVEIYIVVSN